MPVNSICSIMIIIFKSNLPASMALRELRENMYRAKISTFTVITLTSNLTFSFVLFFVSFGKIFAYEREGDAVAGGGGGGALNNN